MAVGGQRPKSAALRLVDGTRADPALPKDTPIADGKPVMPKGLRGRARQLWDEVVPMLFWLAKPDSYKLAEWCLGQAEFEKCGHNDWPVARRSEHRKLGSELGFDPVSRARMSAGGGASKPDEGEKFFGDKRA